MCLCLCLLGEKGRVFMSFVYFPRSLFYNYSSHPHSNLRTSRPVSKRRLPHMQPQHTTITSAFILIQSLPGHSCQPIAPIIWLLTPDPRCQPYHDSSYTTRSIPQVDPACIKLSTVSSPFSFFSHLTTFLSLWHAENCPPPIDSRRGNFQLLAWN